MGSQLQGAGIPKLSKTRLREIASHPLPVVRGDPGFIPVMDLFQNQVSEPEGTERVEKRECALLR